MFRMSLILLVAAVLNCACAYNPTERYSAKGYCFVQSGWQDSSTVCSAFSSPDCYLQCPNSATGKTVNK
jgi:hypothetical protein